MPNLPAPASRAIITAALLLVAPLAGIAQPADADQGQAGASRLEEPQRADAAHMDSTRTGYEMATRDELVIHAPDTDELNEKPFRIEADGTITLPLLGVVKAAGLTVPQLEDDLKERLKTYIRNPVLTITVVQTRAAQIRFAGDFTHPGIYALTGRRTLIEMLMAAGGVNPTAARHIRITRRQDAGGIPLDSAIYDPTTRTSSVEISLSTLTRKINPAEDIVLQPNDTISVEKAEQVYTQGALAKNAGFDIGDKDYISTLQLISLAGGLTPDAEMDKAVVLRAADNSTRRTAIPLDLKRILQAEAEDYALLPNDVLYVPRRKAPSKNAARLGTFATAVAPSLIVYLLLH